MGIFAAAETVRYLARTERDEGMDWVEAFNKLPLMATLDTMRSLDIISEKSLGHYPGMSVHNKLAKILAPARPTGGDRQPALPAPAYETNLQARKPDSPANPADSIRHNSCLAIRRVGVAREVYVMRSSGRQGP
jgi:hypothetical protein